MKRERLICSLWAGALAFSSAIGGLGMMVSGLELPANTSALVPLCLLAAAGLCALLNWKPGGWLAAGLGMTVWLFPSLRQQLKAVARQIAAYMSMAYDTPIPELLKGNYPGSLEPVLLVLGCILMGLWIRCILKGRTTVVVIGVSLIPLAACVTVTDTVPAAQWIFLWALPLILLIMTQSLRRKDLVQSNRLTALLLVPAALFLSAVFWLIPEHKANQWEISGTLEQIVAYLPFTEETPDGGIELDLPTSSSSSQVTLNTLGERILTDRPIMDVSADRSGTLYLRERDYDHYNGIAWLSTEGREDTLNVLPPFLSSGEGEVRLQLQYRKDYYYLPCYAGETVSLQDGMLKNPLRSRSYAFQTKSLVANWKELIPSQPPSTPDPTYRQLPINTMLRAATYLQNSGLNESWSITRKADFIAALVESAADYDLNPDKMPADQQDFAMWFVEESDRGYCVHFASAAAVLLRAAGIPARYVEGYTLPTQPGQTVTVEQRHGHAWVEYNIPGVGWVIIDPTPPEAIQSGQASQGETTESTAPSTSEPVTTQAQQTEPQVTDQPDPEEESSSLSLLLWCILGIVLTLITVNGQYMLRRRRKLRKMHTGHPNRRGLARYRELVRLADYQKVPIPEPLTRLAEKAKFSHHTLTDRELAQLMEHLIYLKQRLAKLPIPKRLIAKFIWALY